MQGRFSFSVGMYVRAAVYMRKTIDLFSFCKCRAGQAKVVFKRNSQIVHGPSQVVGKINMEPGKFHGLARQRAAIGGGIPVGGVAGVLSAGSVEGAWNVLGARRWALRLARGPLRPIASVLT